MTNLVRIPAILVAIGLTAVMLASCAQSVTQSVDGEVPSDELRTCGESGALHRDTPRFWALVVDCERVLGDIDLTFASISSLAPLASVREIEGSLALLENPLDRLTGLERLEIVGADLQFRSLPITGVSELRSLRRVGGELTIMDNPRLGSLAGLESVETVGSLLIYGNAELGGLDGLSGLRRIEGDLRLIENPGLTDEEIAAFIARVEIGGRVMLEPEM